MANPHISHQHWPSRTTKHLCRAARIWCDVIYRRPSPLAVPPSSQFQAPRHQPRPQGRLEVTQSDDFAAFWYIPSARPGLARGAAPAHSLEKIEQLRDHFPDKIRLYIADAAGSLPGGIVVFDRGPVVHVQYVASTEDRDATACLT